MRLGAVPARKLEETVKTQVIYGGRLGTLLLDFGFLSRDELETHLAGFLGVPRPPADWVARPEGAAVILLRAADAGKHRAVPLHIEGRHLHVAMLEPTDAFHLDALKALTGKEIVPYVACESHIAALLDRHYGFVCENRALKLDPEDEIQNGAGWQAPSVGAAPRGPAAGSSAKDVYFEASGEDLAGPEVFETASAPLLVGPARAEAAADEGPPAAPGVTASASGRPPEPAEPSDVDAEPTIETVRHRLLEFEAQIRSARQRDELVRAVLGSARLLTSAAAVFVVTPDEVTGLRVQSEAGFESCTGISVPRHLPSEIARAATAQSFHHGPGPRSGIDSLLLRALHRPQPAEWLLVPVRVEGNTVNLLYADAGPDPIPAVVVGALAALADQMAATYTRLIAEKRARYRQPDAAPQ